MLGRTGTLVPSWRNLSTKYNWVGSLTNCKLWLKFYLPLFHTWLCMRKHPNFYTTKSHKDMLIAKELLHGLRLLSFCSSDLLWFWVVVFCCVLFFFKQIPKAGEGIAYIWKRVKNMLNLIRSLQPNIAGNVRTDRLCILKSYIIAVFNIQKGV